MADRIACCVPFCRRSIKQDGMIREWICGPHWQGVAVIKRRRKYRLYRAYKRRFGDTVYWSYPAGSPKRIECVRLDRLCWRAWNVCKTQAIEGAAGI